MKPCYTYKGRPLTPSGNGKRYSSGKKGGVFRRIFYLVLALGLLAAAVAGGWELTKTFRGMSRETDAGGNGIARETRELIRSGLLPGKFSEGEKNGSGEEAALYRNLYSDYRAGRYAEAREKARRLLSEIGRDHGLYLRSSIILGRSSMALYYGRADSPGLIVYTVKSGDTLSRIALLMNSSVESIQKTNAMNPEDTALRIGEKLKIYKGDWSIEIDPGQGELRLLDGGLLFKIYPLSAGDRADRGEGSYVIRGKRKAPSWRSPEGKLYSPGSAGNILGSGWMELRRTAGGEESGKHSAAGTPMGIHGSDPGANAGRAGNGPEVLSPGYFRVSNEDMNELFAVVPPGTPVRVVGPGKSK